MSTPFSETDHMLAGKVVAVPEARQLDVLVNLLERRGASVLRCPLVDIEDSPNEAAVLAWIERLIALPTDLVVFYTGEGVERLVKAARRVGRDADFVAALGRIPKLTRGPKPKRALRALELTAEHAAADPTTAGLVAAVQAFTLPLGRVALQLYSEEQDRQLVEHLEQRSITVDCVAPYIYASATADERVVELINELGAGRVAAIAFTSKAQVQRLLELAGRRQLDGVLRSGLERTKVAAIGPIVAAELSGAGIRVDTMPDDNYSMKPLVTSICELLAERR